MPTGEMSVGPWLPDLIWYWAAKSRIRRSAGDAARVRDRRPHVVDQLLRISVWKSQTVLSTSPIASGVMVCCRTKPQRLLVLHRGAVLEPEEVVGLEVPAQACGLDRGQAVVRVVEEHDLGTELARRTRRHLADAEIARRVPVLLDEEPCTFGGLIA